MPRISPDCYSQWRCRASLEPSLQEGTDSGWNERLLQLVWHYQRILRDQLRTIDGQTVRVLHPGFWNHEAGPDFRNAMIQIGSGPVRTGDIEIDLQPQGWRGHNHDQNPAYRGVMLHVVWEAEGKGDPALPTLALKSVLDAPLHTIKAWLCRNSWKRFAGPLEGQCCAPLRDLAPELLPEILHQAALVRFQTKAALFEVRARQVGWEQSLWEGLFGALGYKHNVWPMRRVAELLPMLLGSDDGSSTPFHMQARLLGVAGLLPNQFIGFSSDVGNHLRTLWDIWWRQRDTYSEFILPRALWRFNGLRPANHPQRRLALAGHWLARKDFFERLDRWFLTDVPKSELLESLLAALQVECDEFWSWHWTFRSQRRAQPQPLLGAQRVTDLAVNVVLPWFWIRAAVGKNESAQHRAEERYFAWPKAEDNAVLRLARQRLFGGKKTRVLTSASAQQGLLQIVRDFCDHSNALCENCQFPDLVREFKF